MLFSFILYAQTKSAGTKQLEYAVLSANGVDKERGAVNQGRVIEMNEGDRVTITALPVSEEERPWQL